MGLITKEDEGKECFRRVHAQGWGEVWLRGFVVRVDATGAAWRDASTKELHEVPGQRFGDLQVVHPRPEPRSFQAAAPAKHYPGCACFRCW
jgi:hypothetical protein